VPIQRRNVFSGSELDTCGARPRTRHDRPQLHARAANRVGRRAIGFRDPGEVLASRQRLTEVRCGRPLERFLLIRWQFAHVPEHRDAVMRQERDVARVGVADGEPSMIHGQILKRSCADPGYEIISGSSTRSTTFPSTRLT
jgi:hypothetical protein